MQLQNNIAVFQLLVETHQKHIDIDAVLVPIALPNRCPSVGVFLSNVLCECSDETDEMKSTETQTQNSVNSWRYSVGLAGAIFFR